MSVLLNSANYSVSHSDVRVGLTELNKIASHYPDVDYSTQRALSDWNNDAYVLGFPRNANIPYSAYRCNVNDRVRNIGNPFSSEQIDEIYKFKQLNLVNLQRVDRPNPFFDAHSHNYNVSDYVNAKNLPPNVSVQGVRQYEGSNPPLSGQARPITVIDLKNGSVFNR